MQCRCGRALRCRCYRCIGGAVAQREQSTTSTAAMLKVSAARQRHLPGYAIKLPAFGVRRSGSWPQGRCPPPSSFCGIAARSQHSCWIAASPLILFHRQGDGQRYRLRLGTGSWLCRTVPVVVALLGTNCSEHSVHKDGPSHVAAVTEWDGLL